MRKDLGLLRPGDEIAVDLRTLTARRTDLVNDRTRQSNRIRAQLLEIFPALERALNSSKKDPVVLLAGYRTSMVSLRSAQPTVLPHCPVCRSGASALPAGRFQSPGAHESVQVAAVRRWRASRQVV